MNFSSSENTFYREDADELLATLMLRRRRRRVSGNSAVTLCRRRQICSLLSPLLLSVLPPAALASVTKTRGAVATPISSNDDRPCAGSRSSGRRRPYRSSIGCCVTSPRSLRSRLSRIPAPRHHRQPPAALPTCLHCLQHLDVRRHSAFASFL